MFRRVIISCHRVRSSSDEVTCSGIWYKLFFTGKFEFLGQFKWHKGIKLSKRIRFFSVSLKLPFRSLPNVFVRPWALSFTLLSGLQSVQMCIFWLLQIFSLSLQRKEDDLLFSQTWSMKVFWLLLSWFSWNTFVSLKAVFHLGFFHLSDAAFGNCHKPPYFILVWIAHVQISTTLALEGHCYWSFELTLSCFMADMEAEYEPRTYSGKPIKQVKQIMTLWHCNLVMQSLYFCLTSLPNQPAWIFWTAQGLILSYKCLCKCVLYKLTYYTNWI